jgi:hypothetical protein
MGLVITGLDVEWRWVGVLNSVLVGILLFITCSGFCQMLSWSFFVTFCF